MPDGNAAFLERDRLAALHGLCILDTPPEEAFDRITHLAATFFRTPISLVSLIDCDRQWFKSRHGLDTTETPRHLAFCARAILSDDVLLVADASTDPRFADHPLVVGPPYIRFYAGAPLIDPNGFRLGTLCIVDFEPRPWFGVDDCSNLQRLAGVVIDEIGLREELKARRRVEETLRQAREEANAARTQAEQANAAKSRFLAVMSHELRTPMAGIMGIVDLLLDSDLPDQLRDLVRTLKGSTNTLLALLNDILDLSKIEAGQLQLERIDFAPRRVVADIERLFAVAAFDKGLHLSTTIDPALSASLCGDPNRLRQILSNLVCNALKFTAAGRIDVRVRVLEPAVGGRAESLIRFEVEDSGMGMSPTQVAQLFRPFSQAEAAIARRHGGTGLGLAICKLLVEAMNGCIAVDSTPGRGSVFRFDLTLPAGSGDVEEDGAVVRLPAPPGCAGLRVLLAEDNNINRMVITTMLGRRGHRVTGVADGRQAVAAVAEQDFDVVLMDMQMPIMDGMAATRAIRNLPSPRCDVPVIALTADVLPEHKSVYRAAGADEVLDKPIDWARMDGAVRLFGSDAVEKPAAGTDPASPEPEPLLDMEAIDILRTGIGDEQLRHMFELLPDEMNGCVDTIEAALSEKDLCTAACAAHQLRGLAGNFGARRLEAQCKWFEAKGDADPDPAHRMPTLRETLRRTLAGMATLFDPRPDNVPDRT